MEIIAFIIPLIYFLISNITLVFFTKKSFGKCIPITLMLNSLILFLSQILFKTFYIGILFNILFPIFILIYYYISSKDQIKKFKDNYFSSGLIIFLVIYIILFIFDYNKKIYQWDDYMHWGVMLKEMLRLDRLYSVPSSTLLMHKDYPPIVSIFELLFIKVSGGSIEANAIRALHLLELSLFIPVISEIKFKKNNIIKNIIISISLALIVYESLLFIDHHMYYGIINSLYIDYFIGILTGYIIYNIITEKNPFSCFNLINLCISLSFLVLSKQITIIFYILAIFTFICIIFTKYKNKLKEYNILTVIKILLLIIIIPLLFYKGWNFYISNLEIKNTYISEPQFNSSKIEIKNLPKIISKKLGENYQQTAANNFLYAIKKWNITTSKINISYISCIVLCLIIILLLCIFGRKYLSKSQIIILIITIVIGSLGYCFTMLNVYTFLFDSFEAPNLASFDRYMATNIILILSIIIMLFYYLIGKSNLKEKNKIFIPLIISIILFILQFQQIYKTITEIPDYKEGLNDANYIISKTSEDDKIFIVNQDDSTKMNYKIKYYSNPRITNTYLQSWPLEDSFNTYEKDYLLSFDYLYLYSIDDKFIYHYEYMFKDNIKEKTLYRIINDNGKIYFESM